MVKGNRPAHWLSLLHALCPEPLGEGHLSVPLLRGSRSPSAFLTLVPERTVVARTAVLQLAPNNPRRREELQVNHPPRGPDPTPEFWGRVEQENQPHKKRREELQVNAPRRCGPHLRTQHIGKTPKPRQEKEEGRVLRGTKKNSQRPQLGQLSW